jgi:hypothetical protein
MSETLKVLPGVFIKLFRESVEVCQAVSHNRTALRVKTLGAIEIVDDASTNHGVQRHQGPFLITG